MKKIKNIIKFLLGIFFLYFIISMFWNILNMQFCSSNSTNHRSATCEEIARDNATNCKYVILHWKKVNYEKELKKCREWKER